MARGRARSVGQELRGFVLSLLFALFMYWLSTSGVYLDIVTTFARWYAEQVFPVSQTT